MKKTANIYRQAVLAGLLLDVLREPFGLHAMLLQHREDGVFIKLIEHLCAPLVEAKDCRSKYVERFGKSANVLIIWVRYSYKNVKSTNTSKPLVQ